jgi:hypothetical protein
MKFDAARLAGVLAVSAVALGACDQQRTARNCDQRQPSNATGDWSTASPPRPDPVCTPRPHYAWWWFGRSSVRSYAGVAPAPSPTVVRGGFGGMASGFFHALGHAIGG